MKARKLLSAILALLMAAAMIAGCSATTQPQPTTAVATGTPAETAGEATPDPTEAALKENDFTKFDPPVTITTAISLRPNNELRNGDTPENNPVTRWQEETLGIIQKYQWTLTDADNALETRIQLALSSGEELPDVLSINSDTLLATLIESGRIMNIDEAFDKFATKRVKRAYELNPTVWYYVKKDGKKWGLPSIVDGFVGDTNMWIRQDWLDGLGLQVPKTLEELEAVLEAFTNGDPDKNGAKDTYGVAVGANSGNQMPLSDWMGDIQFIFGEDQPYMWLLGGDGKLSYGSIQPKIKRGLEVLQKWYTKGYISPDFVTHDASKAAGEFTSGKAGVFFAPGWCGGWPVGNGVDQAKSEGMVFNPQPYPLPSGLDGETGRTGSPLCYRKYVFRQGFERMDVIFRLWDIYYGGNEEDPQYPFAKGYGEGYDYKTVDGKTTWSLPEGSIELGDYRLVGPGTTPPHVMEGPNIYQRVMQGKKDNIYEQKMADTSGELFIKGYASVLSQLDKDVPHIFVGLPTPTMADKFAGLKKLEEEAQLKIIVGEKPVDFFDEFVKQWLEGGGTKITEEVNQWYEQVRK